MCNLSDWFGTNKRFQQIWRSNVQVANAKQAISILRFYLHKLSLSYSITSLTQKKKKKQITNRNGRDRKAFKNLWVVYKTIRCFINYFTSNFLRRWFHANIVACDIALLCKWIIMSERDWGRTSKRQDCQNRMHTDPNGYIKHWKSGLTSTSWRTLLINPSILHNYVF